MSRQGERRDGDIGPWEAGHGAGRNAWMGMEQGLLPQPSNHIKTTGWFIVSSEAPGTQTWMAELGPREGGRKKEVGEIDREREGEEEEE
jgi:hypothetical protein